jgi:hypothetical protein
VRKQLKAARDDRALVRVKRRKGWLQVEGYVAAVGKEWVAVQSFEELRYGGLQIVRVKDVRSLAEPRADATVTRRAMKHRGMWPPAIPDLLELDDARLLAFTAGSLAGAVSITDERRMEGRFWVGAVHRVTGTWLDLREISVKGRWNGDVVSMKLERLTRLVLWDPYVETITELADSHGG